MEKDEILKKIKEIVEDMRYDSCWAEWKIERFSKEAGEIFHEFIENYLKELSALAYGLNGGE